MCVHIPSILLIKKIISIPEITKECDHNLELSISLLFPKMP